MVASCAIKKAWQEKKQHKIKPRKRKFLINRDVNMLQK